MPRHPSFLLKIKITIFYISLFLSLPPSFSPSLSPPSFSLFPSLPLYMSLPPSFSLSLSLSLTGEEGVRHRDHSILWSLWCTHPCKHARTFCLHVHALSVPHSVRQSVSMHDYIICFSTHTAEKLFLTKNLKERGPIHVWDSGQDWHMSHDLIWAWLQLVCEQENQL